MRKVINPLLTRIYAGVSLCVLFFISSGATSYAGVLDDFQNQVKSATSPMMNNSLQIATVLFSITITLTFVITVARYVTINHTIEGCGHVLMNLFLTVIPLYVIMAGATTFLPNIIDMANQLSGQVTGSRISGPSDIFNAGLGLCADVFKAALTPFQYAAIPIVGEAAADLGAIAGIVAVVISLIIMGSFTLIAFEYFFTFVQAYITLSVGALALGWMGSSGTRHLAEKYIAGAWMSVMRIVVTVACASVIVYIMPNMTAVAQTANPVLILISWLGLGGSSIFAALLTTKIPALATNLFSGQPAITATEVAQDIMRAIRKVIK